MKKLIKLLVLLVVLVLGIGVGLFFFLGTLVKKGVESAGPILTETPVTLAGAKISPLGGKGQLNDFTIANPEGFQTAHAIYAKNVELVVEPKSLMADKIVIRSIRVNQPEITLEGGQGGSNLSTILESINKAVSQLPQGGAGEEPPGTDESSGAATKLQVDEFLITGGKVNFSASFLKGKSLSLSLPEVSLTNLGQGPEGITAAELAKQIFGKVLAGSTSAVSAKVKEMGFDLGDLSGILDGQGQQVLDAITSEGAKQLQEGLKGLFQKKD